MRTRAKRSRISVAITTGTARSTAAAPSYLLLDTRATFYGSATLSYLRATNPLGPWTVQSTISADSCGGTVQGVSVRPTPDGDVPDLMIDLYRSSPGDSSPALPDREIHGDWNQALAGRDWIPLRISDGRTISPIHCTAAAQIPLAHPVTPRTGGPVVAQPDCRITADRYVEQKWTTRTTVNSVRVPVFQRGYVTDPRFPARVQPPTHINRALSVRLNSTAGRQQWSFAATDISWSSRAIVLHVRHPIRAHTRITLQLRTSATDGCYGDLVVPHRSGSYAAIENGHAERAAAQLLMTAGQ